MTTDGSCSDFSDDDDFPQLSVHALAALQEFYQEQKAIEVNESSTENTKNFQENWQLSQFWYDDETTRILVDECIRESGDNRRIACLSTPTLFLELINQIPHPIANNVTLFEYDTRFAVHGNKFVHYDYNKPLTLPKHIERESYDLVIADPPFLSDECIQKFTETIKFITKQKVIICTGSIMEDQVVQLLNARKCSFVPKHKNGLSNDFNCFINYADSKLL